MNHRAMHNDRRLWPSPSPLPAVRGVLLALLRGGVVAKLARLAAEMGLRKAEVIRLPVARRRPETALLSVTARSRPARTRDRRPLPVGIRRTRREADDPE
jgi:hypothetical protein